MQCLRNHFLTASVFACNKDIRVGGANPCNRLQDGLHRRRRGDELRTTLNLEKPVLRRESLGALEGAMQFDLRPQNGKQTLVLPGLLDKVSRPTPHGLHRQFDIAPGGHDDDGKITVERHDFRKKVQAFLTRSSVSRVVEIDQQRIIGVRGQCLPDFAGRLDALHPIALGTKQQLEGFEDVRLVVRR